MTLSQATNIANATVKLGHFDDCTFVSIGHPEDFVVPEVGNFAECFDANLDEEVRIQTSDCISMVCVIFSNAEVIRAAKAGSLALKAIAPLQGDSFNWFFRLEVQTSEYSGPKEMLRVFIFRFPAPLGELVFAFVNRDHIESKFRASLTALSRWAELMEYAGVGRQHGTILSELETAVQAGSHYLPQMLFALGYDGGTVAGIERRQQLNRELASKAALEAMRILVPLLPQGWYLANTLGDAYPFHTSSPGICRYCDSSAVQWTGRSPTHFSERQMEICPRCGTVADLPRGGPYETINISAPNEVYAGDSIAGIVVVRLLEGCDVSGTVLVSARIDTPGLPGLTPWREVRVREIQGSMLEFPFQFTLPLEFPPRQCGIRVLVAARDGIAFAHRPLIAR
ncbi:MAG: hypothetical protein WDO68_21500 [Gammaproteobacteria bacterium]